MASIGKKYMTEIFKYIIYRTPFLQRLMRPRYPYKINPGQLSALVMLIESTRENSASVMEIGVAQGDSSVFLLEHLKTKKDVRHLFLFDTFSGFTPESIEIEFLARGKPASPYKAFRYGDERLFIKGLRAAGYANFRVFKGDASKFDFCKLAPIGAVLLDIDLYQPTLAILNAIWPHMVPGGGIVVDDCLPDTPWDGSLEAVEAFCQAEGLVWSRVGQKGALLLKGERNERGERVVA